MSLTLSNEAKNDLSITNENKPSTGTFGSTPGRTFADDGTFGEPGFYLTKESKNELSISNEAKL